MHGHALSMDISGEGSTYHGGLATQSKPLGHSVHVYQHDALAEWFDRINVDLFLDICDSQGFGTC